ncbi:MULTISPECIES: TetR/AcrR family transcriptional regulator [Pseudonocardia]|uniref:HTH-type transcriptional repressor KstR2 n=2 Tax=Pseudonocardia TaxID=1847 RepID=A0A1Y2NAJ6_PSEAH|nr:MULTISPECIES: TetR/AcrR family transcriptional regulator [Pseudonocardia]OSY43928.1 HTH-type transcriptional repressor KstR2 [Pseudonocardia autotrophica]TDN74339.1 TetR family transcriptional regulator [Pseudonocardia autotrophica]BBG05103.1 TetR family transcriptional regulator [Pseudonocardia autotrophica]GEC28200.1 TetR family transcriptional regulator [Pseudonocardia saturnea]
MRDAEIRAAALEEFVRRGYEAATMGDIGAAVGMRGPSLYKHVSSKQDLLASLMHATMTALLHDHDTAVSGVADPVERLRRAVDAHVRFHARHRREAFVGNRELRSLLEPHRSVILGLRDTYEQRFRSLIAEGAELGAFRVADPQLASYAILDLGMGVAVWFREDAGPSENEVAWAQVEFALRLVGATGP